MERKKFLLPTALIFGMVVANDVNVANAAHVFDNNAAVTEIAGGLSGGGWGFGSTFQTQVSNLSKGLLASAKIIAVIMTALAGCMICFGSYDNKKIFWNWILGIGLAINFGDLILNLWSVESVTAPTKIEDYKLLMKSEDDPSVDILSPFMRYYIGGKSDVVAGNDRRRDKGSIRFNIGRQDKIFSNNDIESRILYFPDTKLGRNEFKLSANARVEFGFRDNRLHGWWRRRND